MASAFAQHFAGDRLEVLNGGSAPSEIINTDMAKAMAEIGIDMAYRIPKTIDAAISHSPPEVIITMGCGEECPYVPGARRQDWDLPDPAGKSIEFMRDVRDEIERRVKDLVTELETDS
jgi:protein-tyrosine-phosphatase